MERKKLYKLKGAIYTNGYELGHFAKEIGINKGTLSSIISGAIQASEDLQARIAQKLSMRRDYLFEL